MVVRLSALYAASPLPPERFLALISVSDQGEPSAILQLEGLGQFTNPMTSLGIKSAAFQLVRNILRNLDSFSIDRFAFQLSFNLVIDRLNINNVLPQELYYAGKF
jgi:hypothetical protein